MRRASSLWIALLLRLYPRRFRARHGGDLRALYDQLYRRDRSRWARFVGGLRALYDTLRDAPGAHADAWRQRRPSAGPALGGRATTMPAKKRPAKTRLAPFGLELRQAVRSLARRPSFSLIVIGTLALGIGANTAIFSIVQAVLLEPLPYPEPERLVRLWGTDHGDLETSGTLAYLDIVDFAEQSEAFTGLAAFDEWTTNLTGDGEPLRLDAARVSASYFQVLGARPALGRFFVPDEDVDGNDRVVVLEHGFWQRRFGGNPGVVGRALVLNGNPHVVVGVAPADFEDPDLSDAGRPPELWRPLGYVGVEADRLPNRGSESYVAIGRLAPGVRIEAAQSELGTLTTRLEKIYPTTNTGRGVALISLQDQLVGDVDESLLLLLGAVGFLLAIAVANVTSMMLGRATERAGESALRTALGASKAAMLRFGMIEGLVLATVGGLAGIALAHLLCRAIVALAATSLPRSARIGIDGEVLLFAVVLSTLVGVACGLVPTLRQARQDRLALGGRGTPGAAGAGVLRLRGALVVCELSLALVLLYGAGLLGQSLLNLKRIDIGVEARGLVTFDLAPPFSRYGELEAQNHYYAELLESLAAIPGVEGVSSTNILPLSGSFDGNALLVPHQPSSEPDGLWSAQTRAVSPGFFETAGVHILRGRPFAQADRAGAAPVAVISESLADRFWPQGDAIGARIEVSESEVEIVGIAGDTKHLALDEEAIWHVYLPRAQGVMWWLGVRQSILLRTSGDPFAAGRGLAQSIRQAVWAVDPEIPIANLRSMQQIVDHTIRHPRLRTALIVAFAAVAVLLSAIGIYGVASYSIALERRAFAVRMALGASRGRIARLVLGRVTAWAMIGAGLGLAGAWGLGRLLRGFVYGVEAVAFWPLVLVPVLVVVALLAAFSPARSALRIEPAVALRGE